VADERGHRIAKGPLEPGLDARRDLLVLLALAGEDHIAARAEAGHILEAELAEAVAQLLVGQTVAADIHAPEKRCVALHADRAPAAARRDAAQAAAQARRRP